MGQLFALLPFVPILLIMLVILVVVHELGHFLAAKRFGVEAPEFGIGFPPRIATLYQSAGWIELQGKRIIIPGKFNLPPELQVGSWVTYKTETRKGREYLTNITPVDDESRGLVMASQVQALDHGTAYTLNAIPLGGFVRMTGEDDPTAPNAFATKPAWQRAIILVAGVVMNFVFAYVVFTALAMWVPQLANPVATTTILGVTANSPAAQADLRVNDTILTVNGVDVRNNRDKMISLLTASCQKPVTLGVERPTPRSGLETLDLQVTPRPFANLPCALGVQIGQDFGVQIATVKPGSLAAQAGLRPGDALVRLGDFTMIPQNAGFGTPLYDEHDLADYVAQNTRVRTTLILRYISGGNVHQTKLTLPENLPTDQADLGLGFHLDLPQAAQIAAERMYTGITLLPRTLGNAFSAAVAGQNPGVMGPVGMTQVLQQTVPNGGLVVIIEFLVDLSLSLAIFNLFPIPGLDGGRLVFVLAEMITRGRRLDPRTEGMIHLAGFAFLLVLILFVMYSDVTRVVSGRSPFGP